MTETKQVSLRADQSELVVRSLKFVMLQLEEDHAGGAHKYVSGPFTYKRLEELVALFEEPA